MVIEITPHLYPDAVGRGIPPLDIRKDHRVRVRPQQFIGA
jgi:hypothetical protein